MDRSDSTCWSVIRGAAEGDRSHREDFATRYAPVIRAFLGSRWRTAPLSAEIDDAVQEVFVDCFRGDGALARVRRERPGGFRAFLYGVTRNVALRFESDRARAREKHARDTAEIQSIPARETSVSRAFDREWARALLAEAARLHGERARRAGAPALRRFELLRLRFQEGLPIREVARRRGEEPERVHREYAVARDEFRDVLYDVVAFHHPGTPGEVRREAARLLGHFK